VDLLLSYENLWIPEPSNSKPLPRSIFLLLVYRTMRQSLKRVAFTRYRTTVVFIATLAVLNVCLLGSATLNATEHTKDNGEYAVYTTSVKTGDTLFGIIERTGVPKTSTSYAIRAFTKIGNPIKLQVGREISVLIKEYITKPPELFAFSIKINKNRYIEVSRSSGKAFVARISKQLQLLKTSNNQMPAEIVSIKVKRGQTLDGLMNNFNIQQEDIYQSVKALKKLYNPKRLRQGQLVTIWPKHGASKNKSPLLGIAVHFSKSVVEVRRGANSKFFAERLTVMTLGQKKQETIITQNKTANGQTKLKKVSVRKGDTLMKLLTTQGVLRTEADQAIQSLRKYFKPRHLRAGNIIFIQLRPREHSLALVGFSIRTSKKKYITVTQLKEGTFTATHTVSHLGIETKVVNKNDMPAKKVGNFKETPKKSSSTKNNIMDLNLRKVNKKPLSNQNENSTSVNLADIRIERGDTLMAILRSEGIDRYEADSAISSLRSIFNPRRLRENQHLIVATVTDNLGEKTLVGFNVKISEGNHIEVQRKGKSNFSVLKVSESDFIRRTTSVDLSNIKFKDHVNDTAPQLLSISKQGQVMDGAVFAAASPEDINFDFTNNTSSQVEIEETQKGVISHLVKIEKGDTLFVALKKAGSKPNDAESAIAAFRTLHNPRNLQIGQKLSVTLVSPQDKLKTKSLTLKKFLLTVAPDKDIQVKRELDKSFVATQISRELIRKLETSRGIIQTSLYDAATDAGLPINILMEMVQIFSFDVDFQRDIQKGDQFEVLYENLMNKQGETVALSPVLFAQLNLSGQPIHLYRYKPRKGLVDYFDEKGQSARKALMRTPISGARLSSGYGMRKHPILGYNKMHRGLDFAAPSGTPIFAAGDGKVEKAGRNGAYGNYIRIRHNSTYKTAYAHLKKFARGVRAGKRVRQGQTIGYVGSTGRSTGPHLHYEIIANGRQINPRKLKLPTGQKLKGKELELFLDQKRKIYMLKAEARRPK